MPDTAYQDWIEANKPAPTFELPPGFLGKMGGEPLYEMEQPLNLLLWREALQGIVDIDWSTMPKLIGPGPGYRGIKHDIRDINKWKADILTANPMLKQLMDEYGWSWEDLRAMTQGMGDAQSGFLPEWEEYEEVLKGTLSANQQELAAQLGTRGMYGAGQAHQIDARTISAVRMNYLQAYQRGRFAQEDIRQASIGRLTGATLEAQRIRRAQEAANLDRQLRAVLGEGGLQLGYAGLELGYAEMAQQQRQFGVEMGFRSYENKMRWEMWRYEFEQRQREANQRFWSDLFEGATKFGTWYFTKGLT